MSTTRRRHYGKHARHLKHGNNQKIARVRDKIMRGTIPDADKMDLGAPVWSARVSGRLTKPEMDKANQVIELPYTWFACDEKEQKKNLDIAHVYAEALEIRVQIPGNSVVEYLDENYPRFSFIGDPVSLRGGRGDIPIGSRVYVRYPAYNKALVTRIKDSFRPYCWDEHALSWIIPVIAKNGRRVGSEDALLNILEISTHGGGGPKPDKMLLSWDKKTWYDGNNRLVHSGS